MSKWADLATRAAQLALLLSLTGFAHAEDGLGVSYGPAQPDDCVTQAANYHSVNSWILRAILQVESGFNPRAMNRNKNGTVDLGIAQMNSTHFRELSKHDVAPRDLLDACKATYVAAWHLRKQINAHGNTWFAVGAYHSATPCFNQRYTGLVWNVLLKWGVVNGPRAKGVSLDACAASNVAQRKSTKKETVASSAVMDLD